MRRIYKTILLLLTAVLSCSNASFAQNGLGTISGKLMGGLQPVSGAEVILLEQENIIDKTTTDENGMYSFEYIRPGKYDLKASKPGHRLTIITHIPVSEDHITQNDIYLGQYNNPHMPKTPIVQSYRDNWRKYMKNK